LAETEIEMVPTSVYVIECGGFIKIGVARDPARRLKELSTGMPLRPRLVGSREFDCAKVAYFCEMWLHRIYGKRRTNLEWFDVPPTTALKQLRKLDPPRPSGKKIASHLRGAWADDPERARAKVAAAFARITGRVPEEVEDEDA
jgi:hypothetical protein